MDWLVFLSIINDTTTEGAERGRGLKLRRENGLPGGKSGREKL